ncbi:MAG: hypothetical protein E6R13_02345 [Spirochaetes bacterium]|nr:MAG: hypothetical protein E6R13_02345 [Spirochaetota bacterium]
MANKVLTPKVVLNINDESQISSEPSGLLYAGIYKSSKGPLSRVYNNRQQVKKLIGLEDPTTTKGVDSINDMLSKSTNVLALRVVRPFDITTSYVFKVTGTVAFLASSGYRLGSLVSFGGNDYTLNVAYTANTVSVGNELSWLTTNATSGLVTVEGAKLSVAQGFIEVPRISVPSNTSTDPYYAGNTLSVGDYLYDPTTVLGDSHSYIVYDNTTGWVTPTMNDQRHHSYGDFNEYSFYHTEAFAIYSIAPGFFYNKYSISLDKNTISGLYDLIVYDENLVPTESFLVSFDVTDETYFVENVVNGNSNLIAFKCNYTLLESIGGILNESFFTEIVPTSVASNVMVNNATNQFVGYSTCSDGANNIYVIGGFVQSSGNTDFLNGLPVAVDFNETVYRYNASSESWLALQNTNPSFGASLSFAQIGLVSCFIPTSNSIIALCSDSTGTSVQAFQYSLSTFGWTDLGIVQDSTLTNTNFNPSAYGIATDSPSMTFNDGKVLLSLFDPGTMSYLVVYDIINNSFSTPLSTSASLAPFVRSVRAPELIPYGTDLLITQPMSGNIFMISVTSNFSSLSVGTSPIVSLSDVLLTNAIFHLDVGNNILYILGQDLTLTNNEYREINLVDGSMIAATDYSNLSVMSPSISYAVGSIVLDPVSEMGYVLLQAYTAGTFSTNSELSEFLSISTNASHVACLVSDYTCSIPYIFGSTTTSSYVPSKSGQSLLIDGNFINFSGTYFDKPFYGIFSLISTHGGSKFLSLGQDLPLSEMNDGDVINTLNQFLNTELYPQLDLLVDCGFNTIAQSQAFAEVALTRRDGHAIIGVPKEVQYNEQSLVRYRRSLNIDTAYASLYAPGYYVRVSNYSGKLTLCPISGAVATLAIKNDNANGPWQVMAGPTNGQADIISKLPPTSDLTPLTVNYSPISYTDTDLLASEQINYLGTYNRTYSGIYLKTDLTLQSNYTDLSKTRIARSVSYISVALAETCVSFLFKVNEEQQRVVITAVLSNILKSISAKPYSLDSYTVICNKSNNSAVDIDNNILNISVILLFKELIEEIRLNVTLDNNESSITVTQA